MGLKPLTNTYRSEQRAGEAKRTPGLNRKGLKLVGLSNKIKLLVKKEVAAHGDSMRPWLAGSTGSLLGRETSASNQAAVKMEATG